MRLSMEAWLAAVDAYGVEAREYLLGWGFHPRVIVAKADKASRRGYADYGVVVDRQWLTDEGRAFLDSAVSDRLGH